jgi:hypothetical protein
MIALVGLFVRVLGLGEPPFRATASDFQLRAQAGLARHPALCGGQILRLCAAKRAEFKC